MWLLIITVPKMSVMMFTVIVHMTLYVASNSETETQPSCEANNREFGKQPCTARQCMKKGCLCNTACIYYYGFDPIQIP